MRPTRTPCRSPASGPRVLAALAAAVLLPVAAPAPAAEPPELPDADIANAIDTSLFLARGVSAHDIDVDVEDGVATLSGEVPSILARDRAVRLASRTKGVRSVVNLVRVADSGRGDREIRRDVVTALARDPATESFEIVVEVEEGTVALDGSVDSHAEKELAATVAKGVRGVRQLENRLGVRYEGERPDADIRAEIEERLTWDVRVDAGLVAVAVDGGDVLLTGSVGSEAERARARSLAWVAGVRSVDAKDLEVRWWARDSMQRQERWPDLGDAEIADAVRDALRYDPRVAPFVSEVEVRVNGGIVTLRGTVGNAKARRAAESDAFHTTGVWSVDNHLRIRSETRPDDEIAEDVRDALGRDPYVSRYDVAVSVRGGEVVLSGDVDSWFDRSQAADVASRVSGVVDVVNRLEVAYASPPRYPHYTAHDPLSWPYAAEYDPVVVREDWKIRDSIESELFWSPFVDANEVDVAVEDGVATLSGEVDSWYERRAATENALEGGAYRVRNRLEVSWGPQSYAP